MDLNKENLIKLRGIILYTIVVMLAVWKYDVVLNAAGFILQIIFPFVLGGAIAFVLNVPMSFLEHKLFRGASNDQKKNKAVRPFCLVLTMIIVTGVFAVVVFFVVPKLGSTFISIGKSIQDFVPKAQKELEKLFTDNKEIIAFIRDIEIDWEKMIEGILTFLKSGAGSVLGSTVVVAKSIVSAATNFVIAFVFACYILLQKERFKIQAIKILYAYFKKDIVKNILGIFSLTYKTFSSFLAGQCVEAVILGTMFVVTMGILRIPYALLIGVLIAFTALIPIFGAFIGCAMGTFLILTVNPMKALLFLVVFFALQQIEGNLIYPKVVGNSVGLPSIWVLVAVSLGGSLMGIVGMLIFIPLASVLYTLFRNNIYSRLNKKRLRVDNATGEAGVYGRHDKAGQNAEN